MTTLLVAGTVVHRVMTPRRVMFIILFLICNQLARLSWAVWLPENLPYNSIPSLDTTRDEIKAPLLHSRYTLFGTAKPSPTAMADLQTHESLRDAPLSSLDVQVTGILASQAEERSIAILAVKGRQTSLAVGDPLPGYNATIAAIFADRVVLSYQGNYESLMLFNHDAKNDKGSSNSGSQSLLALKENIKQQPHTILNYLTISPVMKDNKLIGYRVNPGKQDDVFRRVGLEPNDLAIGLNGLDLRDAKQASQALNQLPQLDEMTITVERKGQLHDIYFAPGDD